MPENESRLVSRDAELPAAGRRTVATKTRKRIPSAATFAPAVGNRSREKRPFAAATPRIAARSGIPAPKRRAASIVFTESRARGATGAPQARGL
jgi:hypothetical protein